MRLETLIRIVLVAGLGVLAGCCLPSHAASRVPNDTQLDPVVPGQVLVKFTPGAADAIERARHAGTLPRVDIASLNELLIRYGVTQIEPAFPGSLTSDEVARRFPRRAARAPAKASIPDLSRTYLLTMTSRDDPATIASAFAADPHVEAAQPNQIMTVQPPP